MLIYLVEDDQSILELEEYALQAQGFETQGFGEGESFFAACSQRLPDLVILDVNLPDGSGLDLLMKLRSRSSVPVILLTANDMETDIVTGLAMGADDYITKPFHLTEVLARVKAILRRTQKEHTHTTTPLPSTSSLITYEEITINLTDKTLTIRGENIPTTRKELELLSFLLQHPLQMFSRQQLLDAVWKGESYVLERTVDVHINHLRKKLGTYADRLQTKSGYGYIWRA